MKIAKGRLLDGALHGLCLDFSLASFFVFTVVVVVSSTTSPFVEVNTVVLVVVIELFIKVGV